MLKHSMLVLLLLSCGRLSTRDVEPQPVDMPQPPSRLPPVQQPGGGDIVAQQQYLIFHNLKRCWHNAPDIEWDSGLAEFSRQHAAKCTYAKDPLIANRYGESIAVGEGLDIIKAQDNWYIAGIFFPYGQATGPDAMAEFSQMVWRSTERVGCASAQCPRGNYYVCRYEARGNVAGSYAENVKPLVPDFFKCTGMPR